MPNPSGLSSRHLRLQRCECLVNVTHRFACACLARVCVAGSSVVRWHTWDRRPAEDTLANNWALYSRQLWGSRQVAGQREPKECGTSGLHRMLSKEIGYGVIVEALRFDDLALGVR